MKINLILPFTANSGGIKVAFEYANGLYLKGHDVVCYAPMKEYKYNNYGIKGLLKQSKNALQNIIRGSTVKWFDLLVPISLIPCINNCYVRNADIVIATAWPTAFSVSELDKNKGVKYYLIQGYEVWSGPKELVDASYKLGLKNIVISNWVKNRMEDISAPVEKIIYNGINHEEYYCENRENQKNINLLLMYNPSKWKGYDDGISAIGIVLRKHSNIKVNIFGLKSSRNIPPFASFYKKPTVNILRKLYNLSDIYIFPSRFEGFGLTALEAMACKCAVVATNTGIIESIGKHKYNIMISEVCDVDLMANNIIELIEDKNLRNFVSNNGYQTAKIFDWGKSIDDIENLFLSN